MKKLNVYIITYGPFEDFELKSISKTYDSLLKSNIDFNINICDNNSSEIFKKTLINTYGNDKRFMCYFEEYNIGKARIVNKIHKISRECDYVCTFDGDLLIESDNFFENLILPIGFGKIKVSVSDLIGVNAHICNRNNSILIENKNYIVSDDNSGMAGCCLMSDSEVWNKIGGYKELLVYGGNDGNYLRQLNNLGYKSCISESSIGYHEKSPIEYQQWKNDIQKKLYNNSYKYKPNSGFYDKNDIL